MDGNWTRRGWMRRCAAGAAGLALSRASTNRVSAVSAVDHLLLGASDLDAGMAWVAKTVAVKPVVGGTHPGVGTRNALLAIGGRRYLEVIAPDPAQKEFRFSIDVRKLSEPRLVTWAAGTADIEGVAKKARDAGYDVFGPRAGSRARPDGTKLEWRTLGIANQLGRDGVEPIPFFIQWSAASTHPSADSPKAGELATFAIEHPDPHAVKDTLAKLGIAAEVTRAERARLVAVLDRTPNGRVELT